MADQPTIGGVPFNFPQAAPGAPAPMPPQATPIATPNVPIASPAGGAPPNNALTPTPPPQPSRPPPTPPTPGGSPKTARDPASDFNLFIDNMLRWAGPPPSLNPFDREHQAEGLRAQAAREEGQLSDLQLKLAKNARERSDAELAQLKPLFDEQDKRVKAAMARVDAAQVDVPKYTPPPTIKPEDAQGFVMGALAVALVGGLAGKAGWMRVSQYFNGALEGLIQGNKERAEEYNRAWQAQYESSMAKLRSTQEEMRNILYATDVPINQILKQAEVQAKIDGADEKYLLARQGHIDKLRQLARDEANAADRLDMKGAGVKAQIDTALIRLGQGRNAAVAGNNLDDYGKWAIAKIAAGGNSQLLATITSRWASPQRAEIFNTIAREWYDQNVDPSTFNENQIGLHVERAAQRWSKVRYEAMGRLQTSLEMLETPLKQAIADANKLHPRAYNTPVNDLMKQFGSGMRTEKIAYVNTIAYTVGREYGTLATMPVSNAQMHWGAQELADKMVKGSASLAEIMGFYEAVKLETKVNRTALDLAVQSSMRDVESMGQSVRPEDFGIPARAAPTGADWEQKYGAGPASPTTH